MIEIGWVDGILPLLELCLTQCLVSWGKHPIMHMVGRLFTVYYVSKVHRFTEL
jgi:hypothetical protein